VKTLKAPREKKSSKQEREYQVLVGLIESYIDSGKPIGSNTLKDAGFDNLSSATIRNYFANLEIDGYLTQQHTSGGRIPTEKAFQFYANEVASNDQILKHQRDNLDKLRNQDTKEIAAYLQSAVETLSDMTNCAVFISAPRFDHDYISAIKIVALDRNRLLCVLITDFGVIQTETLQLDTKLSAFTIKRMEEYCHWRLTGHDKPENITPEEEELAQRSYNEIMVRYVVSYSTFTHEDVYRTGFSKLLAYPEFHEASTLANSLKILENKQTIRLLLRECSSSNSVKWWIGNDFDSLSHLTPECSVIAIPYFINKQSVGAVGIMGPIRMAYKNLFGIMKNFSDVISETLTHNVYKFKISFRQPNNETSFLQKEEQKLLANFQPKLLEDKRL